jgi:DNA replication ATP-dependent helicase Dna2
VPTLKVGRTTQRRGLSEAVACHEKFSAWDARPTNGYVVGATPFATCSQRLDGCEFDCVIFDEASQITTALALMAMRKGRRFIFVGDAQQLPPVMLSASILGKNQHQHAVLAALTSPHADHTVMLTETYRMNRWLTDWPSRTYYSGALMATGANEARRLTLARAPKRLEPVFDPHASGIFIPTLDVSARTQNFADAALVVELCVAAVEGGLPLVDIGIVTPYRAQGRAARNLLSQQFGRNAASQVIADTVERMQGQERELIILSLATGDAVFLSAVAAFFFQPQRLNVSITRAVSKLIVIGPEVGLELARSLVFGNSQMCEWVTQYSAFLAQLKRVNL